MISIYIGIADCRGICMIKLVFTLSKKGEKFVAGILKITFLLMPGFPVNFIAQDR